MNFSSKRRNKTNSIIMHKADEIIKKIFRLLNNLIALRIIGVNRYRITIVPIYHPPGITLLLQNGSNPCKNNALQIMERIPRLVPKLRVLPASNIVAVFARYIIRIPIYQPGANALKRDR